MRARGDHHADYQGTTEGPSWGHSKVVIGAIRSFLGPVGGHLSPKIDKVSEELTWRYPHEQPCVAHLCGVAEHERDGERREVREERETAVLHHGAGFKLDHFGVYLNKVVTYS